MSERNTPTPAGYGLGKMLADGADRGEPAARLADPALLPRCKSCAFRAGSFPNGCEETVVTALHCVGGASDFRCHQKDRYLALCSGYIMARYDDQTREVGELARSLDPELSAKLFKEPAGCCPT